MNGRIVDSPFCIRRSLHHGWMVAARMGHIPAFMALLNRVFYHGLMEVCSALSFCQK